MNSAREKMAVEGSGAKAGAVVANIRPIWIAGSEDIVIDHGSGWAYVSSQSRPPGAIAASGRQQGAIFGLDLKQDRPQPINLTDELFASEFSQAALAPSLGAALGEAAADQRRLRLVRPDGAFHPAGISLFATAGGTSRLFAINRRSSSCATVEIFDIGEGRLAHMRTVQDERHLISPNDLVATAEEQFYVTNDHGFSNLLLQGVENLLHYIPQLQFGSIAYFDGQRFTTVAHGLSTPNGIAVDLKAGRMYVASVLGKSLLTAKWNKDEPARELSFSGDIRLPSAPDNLEWDPTGDLWIGAHPDFTALSLYMMGLRPTSPSCVLRISKSQLPAPEPPAPEPPWKEMWRDDGTQLSSSSVAGLYKRADGRNLLLIGAAFDDHMLLGELRGID